MFTREKEMVVCRMKDVLLFIVLLLLFPLASAAKVGEWKSYTNMQNVRGVASDGSSIWVATSGGVFRFNPADSTYQKFTNSDGLTSNDVTAITVDAEGKVWIGEQSGAIDVYNPRTQQWQYISDIAVSTKTNKRINQFFLVNDTLYIATAFGVTVFSLSQYEFLDTYNNFASTRQPSVIAMIKFNSRIFAATSQGIVVSKTDANNLADPASWEITPPSSLRGNSLSIFNGELYLGEPNGVYRFSNNMWNLVMPSSYPVQIVTSSDTKLFFYEKPFLKFLQVDGSISTVSISTPDSTVGGIITSDGILFGFSGSGIGLLSPDSLSWQTYYPNGPGSNTFASIVFDAKNVLWAGPGFLASKGFYSFNGTEWRNYSPALNNAVQFWNCTKIAIGNNDAKWVASDGGVTLLDEFGNVRKTYRGTNPGFGKTINYNDTLIFGIAADAKGNIWFSNHQSINDTMLFMFSPDSHWTKFKTSDGYNILMDMIIDNEGTKWFTSAVPLFNPNLSNKQLSFFNEKNNIEGTINGWGKIGLEDGLTNVDVTSLALDANGDIWVGTAEGITIITTPRSPKKGIRRVFLEGINSLFITCIGVDALNNKWIGTSQGVFVLSPDGTQLSAYYNTTNTNGKLADNNVISIAFDKKKGLAYFGTEKGLSSLEIPSIAVKSSLSTIDLSPNPVYLPEHDAVEIRGLVEESTIKILTINGKVLKQFPAQGGGRAFWDCKDGDGNSVASGIYIIVAHDKSGTQAASAKVAVIRK